MLDPDPSPAKLSTVLGAALYLMTSYRRSRCPRVALMVARHLECVAAHRDSDATMRQLCTSLSREWNAASAIPAPAPGAMH
jgi:hypothetical protein